MGPEAFQDLHKAGGAESVLEDSVLLASNCFSKVFSKRATGGINFLKRKMV